ncbi:MAG: hypothetical protein CVU87_09360 [Firmicutes bacterium HGW-Firmicutes-12]|jgi:agmatinase|nr:MAG: hypothetical protein CVU87_09360 [Firmicutes bacterium HGW-Firmicutes-12]
MIQHFPMMSPSPTLFNALRGNPQTINSNTIGVVGMPSDWTHSSRIGSRLGPAALRRASTELVKTIFEDCETRIIDAATQEILLRRENPLLIDCGNAPIYPESPESTTESIAEITRVIRSRGAIPLSLGGDHYNSYPACLGFSRGLADINPEFKFGYIQIDGHLDFSDRLGAWGEFNHATNGRRISELPNIVKSNMVWIGITGWVDCGDIAMIEEMGGKVFTSEDIHRIGAKKVAELALKHATRDCESIYLSIDIDATDAGFLPGTGSIVQSRVAPRQLCEIMDIYANAPIGGIDIVEVAPDLDPSGRSERISAYYLLRLLRNYLFKSVA